MIDLRSVTYETFEPCLNQPFRIRLGETALLTLTLAEVTRLGGSDPARTLRQSFALLFLGPAQPTFPQMIHALEHDGLGVVELFLVPLGPDERGMRYEAIFT